MNRVPAVGALFGLVMWSSALSAGEQDSGPAFHAETIYGNDDRMDLYQLQDWRLRDLADSTVALWKNEALTPDFSGAYDRLSTEEYGLQQNLCLSERFRDQPVGSYCSGALVGPDLVLTAGHCVWSQDICRDTKIVFGFSVRRAGAYPEMVPAHDVYSCAQLVHREEDGAGPDWSLIRLDRSVTGHRPLAINRTGQIADGTPLAVIGHPNGLPTKAASGAVVLDASPQGYFVSNLDIYGGNSGSPVFNLNTGLIEGLVVRRGYNAPDFVYNSAGRCNVSYVCPQNADGCGGDQSTKISALASFIPQLGYEAAKIVLPDLTAFSVLLEAAHADGDALNRQ